MSVRIRNTRDFSGTVLRVDGYLTAEDVDELDREYCSVQGASVLDLTDLQSADAEGVRCLQRLISLGAEIRGSSHYIALLLEDER